MSHPFHHALSSARKYGGTWRDYIDIHNWFDESKKSLAFFTHRALRHHAEGIFEAERVFGVTRVIKDSCGRSKEVPVRFIGEQHVKEDLGRIPTLADWLRCLKPERWMSPTTVIEKELKRVPVLTRTATDILYFCSNDCRTEFSRIVPGRYGSLELVPPEPIQECHNCSQNLEVS